MASLFHSMNFLVLVMAFVAAVFIPTMILYVFVATPYWIWEGFQIQNGRVTQEYLENRSVYRFFSAPFRFYFSKLFRLEYKL